MAQIAVDTGALRNAAHTQAGLAGSFEVGSGVLSSIAAKLDWEFEAAQAVEAQLKRLAQRLGQRADAMRRHSHYLEYVADTFERAEGSLIEMASRFGGGVSVKEAVDAVLDEVGPATAFPPIIDYRPVGDSTAVKRGDGNGQD